MSADLKLEKFQGPLDLLLKLIDDREMEITEVSLSEVTEQYLRHLDSIEKNRPAKLADFLVIATKLIYLKSRQLLPYLYPDDEDEGPKLADQLKMYKTYLEASTYIEEKWNSPAFAYGRIEKVKKLKEFVLPANSKSDDLLNSFQQLLRRIKPVKPLPQATIDHTVSVKQTVDKIRDLLKKAKKINFAKYFNSAKNRSEVIVGFLALLELLRKKDIIVRQQDSYADLSIESL